jgi:hypothetical protein
MPSYRVTMTIGMLRPGVDPGAVLPAARQAALDVTTLEAADLAVVARSARITIRFTADDAEIAAQVAAHVIARTGEAAEVTRAAVTERVRGDWVPVPGS